MNLDAKPVYTISVTPQPEDIDGLEHTNNAVYVRWCERAAWEHSAALGLTIADYRRLNRAMAIRSARYDYLVPTAAGEQMSLATWLTREDGKAGLERHFQLVRDRDNVMVLRGAWSLVCIEISSGRARRMPAEFVAAYLPLCRP